MMRLWLKILLGVVGGFAGGFAAGFFTHKKINEVQFEEVSEEELDKLMESMPNDILSKIENNTQETHSKAPSKAEKALDTYSSNPDKLRNALQGKTPFIAADDEKKKEYSKMWQTVKGYSNEENANDLPVPDEDNLDLEKSIDKEFMDILDDVDDPISPPGSEKIFKISLGEFYQDHREYDKITIDWYDEDDILLDEREEIIADPTSYVGCQIKELFAGPSIDGDPDAVYVRNDKYATDYEVIRHHASYKKMTIGDSDD